MLEAVHNKLGIAFSRKTGRVLICDNFLFQKVMQNKRLCKRLIQKLLKINVKKIIYPVAEKSIAIGATSKSVRLDLYVETDEGTIVDIEIQTTDGADGWLPKRTRYYQAMIDLDVLGKGHDYIELKSPMLSSSAPLTHLT